MEASAGIFERIFGAWRVGRATLSQQRLLADAPARRRLRVDAIDAVDPIRSDRLASLGLVAGCELVLRQRHPAFVLDIGETTLAVDHDLARTIHVTLI